MHTTESNQITEIRTSPVPSVRTWMEGYACRWQWPVSEGREVRRPPRCCDVSRGSHGWLSTQQNAQQARSSLANYPTAAYIHTQTRIILTANLSTKSLINQLTPPPDLHNTVKVRTLDIAPLRESSPQKHSGIARVLKRSHTQFYLHTHTFIRNWKWAIPAFAFPAIAGTHIPTQEGWKAWVAGYIVRQFTCPKAVTHPITNRAQRRATVLIKTNVLPLH